MERLEVSSRVLLHRLAKDYLSALQEDDYCLQRGWEAERRHVQRRVRMLEAQMAQALARLDVEDCRAAVHTSG